jgi:hypothetical protein
MKLKKISLFDIDLGKVIEAAEKGISELWKRSEKHLERWLQPKSKHQKYLDKQKKKRKQELKTIAKEHEGFVQMHQEPNEKTVNERFAELETQTKEKENEASLDADIER